MTKHTSGEPAAADPTPVVKGTPKGAATPDAASPSKADLERSALFDEFESLKAQGKTNTPRFSELKRLLAGG